MTEEMVGILPRCVQELLNCQADLNGDQLKVVVSGRYGFVKPNQTSLGPSNAFVPILNTENFTNKVLSWTTNDSMAQIKTMLIQFKVEKMVTNEQSDVNFLSIYRFPTLDAYKTTIKLAKIEAERALHFKLVNTSFKPNKLQILGVLTHLNLTMQGGQNQDLNNQRGDD